MLLSPSGRRGGTGDPSRETAHHRSVDCGEGEGARKGEHDLVPWQSPLPLAPRRSPCWRRSRRVPAGVRFGRCGARLSGGRRAGVRGRSQGRFEGGGDRLASRLGQCRVVRPARAGHRNPAPHARPVRRWITRSGAQAFRLRNPGRGGRRGAGHARRSRRATFCPPSTRARWATRRWP